MEKNVEGSRQRTKKPESAKRNAYILVKLTAEEKERIKKLAYSKGLDMSEYIRMKIFE